MEKQPNFQKKSPNNPRMAWKTGNKLMAMTIFAIAALLGGTEAYADKSSHLDTRLLVGHFGERSKEHGARSKEHEERSKEYEKQSAQYGEQSAQYGEQSKEHEAQSKEHEAQSKEHEAQSKEHEARSKEYERDLQQNKNEIRALDQKLQALQEVRQEDDALRLQIINLIQQMKATTDPEERKRLALKIPELKARMALNDYRLSMIK